MKHVVTKRPTRTEVAERAGVSVATVSYVINNGPRPVSNETRVRVLAVIQELGYRPNSIAQSLKTGTTRTVGLLAHTLRDSFVTHLVTAVEDILASYGYALLLASSHEDTEREEQMLDVLSVQALAGLLYVPVATRQSNVLDRLLSEGMPIVFMDRYIPGVAADVVATDNVVAARQATQYMIDQGARRIACVAHSSVVSSALERIEGYRQALHAAKFDVRDQDIMTVHYIQGEHIEPAIVAYAEQHGWPDGIFCTTDEVLVHTMKALMMQGIRYPEQILVTGGFFNSPWNQLMAQPIPVIHQNHERIAQRAIEFLMERLKQDDLPPRMELIPAEFLTK